MEMHTIALIRGLMLAGMIWPLVIAGVVAAIREKRDASELDADAPARPRQRPVVIGAVARDPARHAPRSANGCEASVRGTKTGAD